MKHLLIALLLLSPISAWSYNFDKANKLIRTKVYQTSDETFYCGCDIKKYGLKIVPDLKGCGYKNRKSKNLYRAERGEVEHIMSASEAGKQMQCWRRNGSLSGRKNCRKNSPIFNVIEGDLHNLTVAIGEVNLDRSNFKFNATTKTQYHYGSCPIRINPKTRTVTPPDNRRGDVARAYLYMADRYKNYGVKLSAKQRALYMAWHKMDPVDAREKQLEAVKASLQGNSNTWITEGRSPTPHTGHPEEGVKDSQGPGFIGRPLTETEKAMIRKSEAQVKKALKQGLSKFGEYLQSR